MEGAELKKFYETHLESGAGVSVLTADAPNPFGYGRILRDSVGRVTGIVEEKDASEAQRKIHEINTGIYCVEMPLLFTLLENLSNDNAQGEYYLTDILAECLKRGRDVCGIKTQDFDMVMGINSRRQLAQAQRVMNERIVGRLMDEGVTIMDPSTTFVEKGSRWVVIRSCIPLPSSKERRKSARTASLGPMFALRMSPSAMGHPSSLPMLMTAVSEME